MQLVSPKPDSFRTSNPRKPTNTVSAETGPAQLEFLGVLKLLANWSPDEQPEQLGAPGSCPCQLFRADQDPFPAAKSLSLAIAEVCRTESLAENVIFYTLSEIAQNVVDHAEAQGGAVGIAEVTMGGAEIEVAIADFGVGIRSA